MSCGAKVGLSIVESVAIDVVHEHSRRDAEDLTVHRKLTMFSIFGFGNPDGVEGFAPSGGMPFVFDKVEIIVGVHDGEFALGERYAAKGVAVAKPAIEKDRQN